MQMTACLEKMSVAARFFGRASFANTIPAISVWIITPTIACNRTT